MAPHDANSLQTKSSEKPSTAMWRSWLSETRWGQWRAEKMRHIKMQARQMRLVARRFPALQTVLFLFLLRATTHADLILRALEQGVKYQVVHNASILTAVGCCGLQVGRSSYDCDCLHGCKGVL